MLDLLGRIATLERPSLLVRAARFGMARYDRSRCVARLINAPPTRRMGEVILRLLEAELEGRCRAREAGTLPRRHVDLLIALRGESRLLRESLPLRLVAA